MGTVTLQSYTMKQFAAVFALLVASGIGGALGRPRYLVIQIDDDQQLPTYNPVYNPYYAPSEQPQYIHRVARSAYPQQEETAASAPLLRAQPPNPENRRAAPPPPPPPYGQGPAPVFEIPAELRQNGDAIAAGSNQYGRSTPHGQTMSTTELTPADTAPSDGTRTIQSEDITTKPHLILSAIHPRCKILPYTDHTLLAMQQNYSSATETINTQNRFIVV